MSEEINKIINNLCDRLGTSAKLLIPELARLRIAESVIMLITFLLILVTGIICIRKFFKILDENEDVAEAFLVIGVGASIIGFLFTVTEIHSLVGWLVSPRAKAVLEIVRMVK